MDSIANQHNVDTHNSNFQENNYPMFDKNVVINFVSSACFIITIVLSLVPYKAIKQVKENKSVGQLAGIQFISALLNGLNWTLYSALTGAVSIFIVNFLCSLLSIYYLSIYMKYLSPVTALKDFQKKLLYAGIVFFVTVVIARLSDDPKNVLGMIASTFSVINYAAPLEKIKDIIAKKSSEGMVPEISVMSLLCSMSWTTLGFLIDDVYIYLPNVIASVLSAIQCTLIIIYPAPKKKSF